MIVEGTQAETLTPSAEWKEYEFKGKPGDVCRTPPIIAPYHWRLDWQMWFVPFSPGHYSVWFIAFVLKLLENDPQILKLVARNPFPDRPPKHIRAQFYQYRFSNWEERRATGQWWVPSLVGEYLPPVSTRDLRAIEL